jgi:hypothetical protein
MNTRRIALMTLSGMALAGILAAASPAAADSYTGYDGRQGYYHGGQDYRFRHDAQARIDARQRAQQERINHGIATRALAPWEARILEREQATIRYMENRALADGRLSRREWTNIEQAQDRASQNIERLTHNQAHRYYGSYR